MEEEEKRMFVLFDERAILDEPELKYLIQYANTRNEAKSDAKSFGYTCVCYSSLETDKALTYEFQCDMDGFIFPDDDKNYMNKEGEKKVSNGGV